DEDAARALQAGEVGIALGWLRRCRNRVHRRRGGGDRGAGLEQAPARGDGRVTGCDVPHDRAPCSGSHHPPGRLLQQGRVFALFVSRPNVWGGCNPSPVMAGLVPAIHVLLAGRKTWMPATSAGMTRKGGVQTIRKALDCCDRVRWGRTDREATPMTLAMTLNRVLSALFLSAAMAGAAFAQAAEPALALARKEKPALLDTLKALVSIESGSRDIEGLNRLADLIAGRLRELGGQVELVEPSNVYKMEDTPDQIGKMVRATFTGTGSRKILLIAHMDTVYQRGMIAKQPFRVDGDHAYGLGIADDKQGIAVILHTIAMLKALDYREFGTLTVLINADEELSSPGSRSLITELGAEHDAVFSLESSRAASDKLALATSGIASVTLAVEGRASHAGSSPENGVNALYELAHQVLQTRDLSDPAVGLKMNWTMASAGQTRNMIPPKAQAMADIRVLRVADYDGIERKVRERIRNKLLPGSKVEMILCSYSPPPE